MRLTGICADHGIALNLHNHTYEVENGERDLNGVEYEAGPDKIDIPRFTGQRVGVVSQLVLINLTGAVQFDTTVSFAVYDDDEHAFSATYTFRCWRKVRLNDISGVFNNSFLSLVSSVPSPGINAPLGHMGWMRLDGLIASSTATSIANPMILANLLENLGSTDEGANLTSAASFPQSYVEGTQTNGALISASILGN